MRLEKLTIQTEINKFDTDIRSGTESAEFFHTSPPSHEDHCLLRQL